MTGSGINHLVTTRRLRGRHGRELRSLDRIHCGRPRRLFGKPLTAAADPSAARTAGLGPEARPRGREKPVPGRCKPQDWCLPRRRRSLNGRAPPVSPLLARPCANFQVAKIEGLGTAIPGLILGPASFRRFSPCCHEPWGWAAERGLAFSVRVPLWTALGNYCKRPSHGKLSGCPSRTRTPHRKAPGGRATPCRAKEVAHRRRGAPVRGTPKEAGTPPVPPEKDGPLATFPVHKLPDCSPR